MTEGPRRIAYSYAPAATTTLASVSSGFVFAPRYNSAGKSDGSYFTDKARRFCAHHGLRAPLIFDNDGNDDTDHRADDANPRNRRAEILTGLAAAPSGLQVVAYFGHGGPNGLLSAGIRRPQLAAFADAIASKAARRMVIVLNACSCGVPGGFAEQLRHAMTARGINATVFAHQTSGDAVANPYKRRFPAGGFLVEPSGEDFRTWGAQLRGTDLWMRYPFMEPHALHDALLA